MKIFKIKNNIIIESIVSYFSILFLAIPIDSTFLADVGLVIAPGSIIYFNKRFKVKPIKYYLSKTILEGTISGSGKYDPCDICH